MAIMTAISVIITFFIILFLLNVRAAKVRNNPAPSKQKWKTSLVKTYFSSSYIRRFIEKLYLCTILNIQNKRQMQQYPDNK